jgi:hypothetical protein
MARLKINTPEDNLDTHELFFFSLGRAVFRRWRQRQFELGDLAQLLAHADC